MKATLKQIRDSSVSVQLLLSGKRMPPKASYAVSKLAVAVAKELEHYDEQRRKFFLDAGCTVNAEKNIYEHADGDEKLKELSNQLDEMLGAEVEINALPLDLEQFGNAELDGAAFFGLEWAMK